MNRPDGQIETPALSLSWSAAPWDGDLLGSPVWQIDQLQLRGDEAAWDFLAFEQARDAAGAALVSCRLDCDRLAESMLLEARDFRFIEMLYQPVLVLGEQPPFPADTLVAEPADESDLPRVADIAQNAFRNERWHVDPRLDSTLADRRYRNWAVGSLRHPRQRLTVLRDEDGIVAFFVWEKLDDGTLYWHLNAVAPGAQGKGVGKRAWKAMIRHAWEQKATRVKSSIVARNHRVLNLYAGLGFRFSPPQMTFHWVRDARP